MIGLNATTKKVSAPSRRKKCLLTFAFIGPVVHCAYGYQKEKQEEACEIEENCGQEVGADEDGD